MEKCRMKPDRNATGRQRGAAAVELGILLFPLTLLAFGITEFGRAVYQYNTIVKAVRNASRHLSQHGAGDATHIGIATCLAAYGNRTCSGSPLLPGLSAAMVQVCDRTNCSGTHENQSTGAGVVNLVTVTVSGYTFNSLVPLVTGNIVFDPISSTMRQVL
jgi:Flp pilus assembly protein TadG